MKIPVYGKICPRHPELNGRRTTKNLCCGCLRAKHRRRYWRKKAENKTRKRSREWLDKFNALRRTPEYRAKKQEWRRIHRIKIRTTGSSLYAQKSAQNLQWKFKHQIRTRIYTEIKKAFGKKTNHSFVLLGCTYSEAIAHIEKQFQPGMTWDNWGNDGWHLDHIIPCSAFDLSDPEQQKKCFHYTNLQPLWAKDNLVKSNKLDWAA